MQQLFQTLSFAGTETALFIISMIPIVELRGAVPLGAAMGLSWPVTLLVSVVGNMVPVPFIIIFGKHLFAWLKKTRMFSKMMHAYENRLMKKATKVMKYSAIGLCLFVAVPLPGTGAWSGAAIAVLLDMRLKYALPSIALGVLISGLIMTLGSYGVIHLFGLF